MKTNKRILVPAVAWPPPSNLEFAVPKGNRTKRSHFNPAFWTALWNPQFFHNQNGDVARKQSIEVLDFRAVTIRSDRIENIHAENALYEAVIKAEDMIALAMDEMPEGAERDRTIAELHAWGDTSLEGEDFICHIENSDVYRDVIKLAKTAQVDSVQMKANVALFIVYARCRHPSTMKELTRIGRLDGQSRWSRVLEYFKLFTHRESVSECATTIAESPWILHCAKAHTFPLPDFCVLINASRSRIWIAVSPRILLEIDLTGQSSELCCRRHFDHQNDFGVYTSYRELAIGHATTQIIFHDRNVLETWKETPEFRRRCQELKSGTN